MNKNYKKLLIFFIQVLLIQPVNGMLPSRYALSKLPSSALKKSFSIKKSIDYKLLPTNKPIGQPSVTVSQKPIISSYGKSSSRFSLAFILSALGLGWLWSNQPSEEELQSIDELVANLQEKEWDEVINVLQKFKDTKKADEVFERLVSNEDFVWKMVRNFSGSTYLPKQLIPFIKKNYEKLSLTYPGARILGLLIKNDSTAAQELIVFTKKNLENICREGKSAYLFDILMNNDLMTINDFAELMHGKVRVFTTTRIGNELINDMLNRAHYGEDNKLIVPIAKERAIIMLESDQGFSPKIFNACAEQFKDDADIALLIKQKHKDDDFISLLRESIYNKHCVYCQKIDSKNLTISERTLYDQIEDVVNIVVLDKYIVSDPGLCRLVMDALKR